MYKMVLLQMVLHTVLTALILLILSRDLVILRYLFFRLLIYSLTEGS